MIRVAFFCNHWMALPSLFTLKERGVLAGVAVPEDELPIHTQIRNAADTWGIPFKRCPRHMEVSVLNEWFTAIQADSAFVLTFPYKIPFKVISLLKNGFLNLHPGILPKYRGREPVFWQIYNRESFGGISVHKMDDSFDSGPLLHIEKIPILGDDTYGLHLNKLSICAQKAVIKVIDILTNRPDEIPFIPQENDMVFHAVKPKETDLLVRWDRQPAIDIKALVRAANPWSDGPVVNLRGIPFYLVQVSVTEYTGPGDNLKPGTILCADKNTGLNVKCCDRKILSIEIIKGNEGTFTGALFSRVYGLKKGEQFLSPTEHIVNL